MNTVRSRYNTVIYFLWNTHKVHGSPLQASYGVYFVSSTFVPGYSIFFCLPPRATVGFQGNFVQKYSGK